MSDSVRRRFEATPWAIREARAFVREVIARRVDAEAEVDLVLVVSELATNAVRHAQTPFDVVVRANGHVRLEIEDGSTEVPVPRAPSEEGGRGLAIVDQLCDRWGVIVVQPNKCVWCERDL